MSDDSGASARCPCYEAVLLSLLVFALAFSPWPLRNLVRFGAPHPTGELCDTRGQALRGAGLMSWFATWLAEESELPKPCGASCVQSAEPALRTIRPGPSTHLRSSRPSKSF